MAKHSKHAKLDLRRNGIHGPFEIAIVGTSCSSIESFVGAISKRLRNYKIAYMDASHASSSDYHGTDAFTFHKEGSLNAALFCEVNKFNQRIQFASYDLVFINGNHFEAAMQIVVLDNEKEASLKKRLGQLSDVKLLVRKNEGSEVFGFLKESLDDITTRPMYGFDESVAIADEIESLIQENVVPLRGLVLAGGKSVRMGVDKGTLVYGNDIQRNVVFDMMESKGVEPYLSVRSEQEISDRPTIEDVFLGLGPFGAICSAFQKNPNVAWLVLATDLPFLDEALIRLLIEERDPSKIATTVKGSSKEFPEPLVTIWEPKSYPVLLSYLSQGYSCPRKVLINSDVKVIEIDDRQIRNINTPEEFEAAKKELKS